MRSRPCSTTRFRREAGFWFLAPPHSHREQDGAAGNPRARAGRQLSPLVEQSWGVVERAVSSMPGSGLPRMRERLAAAGEACSCSRVLDPVLHARWRDGKEESCNGWFRSYNFGSLGAAEERWRAAQRAGVDYIASDQYELLGEFLRRQDKPVSKLELRGDPGLCGRDEPPAGRGVPEDAQPLYGVGCLLLHFGVHKFVERH